MNYLKRVEILFITVMSIILIISCDTTKRDKPPITTIVTPSQNNLSVTGLEASVLNYSDRIELKWDRVEGADGYRIYRYLSKSDNNPLHFEVKNNSFSDKNGVENGAKSDLPYYYRVSSLKDSKESDKSGYVMGMRSQMVDYYENSAAYLNNDDLYKVEGQTTGTIFKSTVKPLIYYIPDGSLKANLDSDWYKYVGPPGGFNINIKLKRGTGFKTGDLKFRVSYKGKRSDPENVLIGPAESSHSFSKFEGQPDNVVIYYQIYVDETVLGRTNSIIEEYTVKVGL